MKPNRTVLSTHPAATAVTNPRSGIPASIHARTAAFIEAHTTPPSESNTVILMSIWERGNRSNMIIDSRTLLTTDDISFVFLEKRKKFGRMKEKDLS